MNRYLNRTPPRYLALIFMVIAEILTASSIKITFDYFMMSTSLPPEEFWRQFKMVAGLDFQRTLFFLFISTVIWSAINWGRLQRKTTEALLRSTLADKTNAELRFQFAQAQNAFLKQQINPHLLFNTLNAIYSTVYLNAPKDSEALLLLSEIMRYSYEEPDSKGLVALESELFQLKNLIKLNTYRFRDTVQLDFDLKGDANNHRIIPLVLLTLTENMFKHGDLRQRPRSLGITINEGGQLSYFSNNVRKLRGQVEPNGSVGLTNTRLRLDYAYPGNYNLDITQTEELFTVNLNINLAYERSDH
ncbi:sensor histidine kinase [Mucilaginibacter rubeus]|uniref:sensor histidine kinase n=1 Tax=Mucilaginibacter rubeus TaxID=2027860 RepID=UPI0016816C86|nr:histidine kinase [Mucilaginibacter rubeus]